MAELAEHVSKIVKHHRAKSTQPIYNPYSFVRITYDIAPPDRAPVRRPVHGRRPPALLPLRAQAVPRPGHPTGLRGDGEGVQPNQEREGRADLISSNQSAITLKNVIFIPTHLKR